MLAPGIVLFEKRPRWEAVLKRAFAADGVEVRVCRLPAQVPPLLSAMPGSVLVLDLESRPDECLRLIERAAEWVPRVPVVVVGLPALAELEWPARELGALEFLADVPSGEELERLCRRQLRLAGRDTMPVGPAPVRPAPAGISQEMPHGMVDGVFPADAERTDSEGEAAR
jgi:DNA-binding NtrC family response regulator